MPNLSFDAHADGALETGVEIWVWILRLIFGSCRVIATAWDACPFRQRERDNVL